MAIRAKKSLGQHFLSNPFYLEEMVRAGGVIRTDTVVEIGPGTGNLTQKLLETGAKVIAIEKDARLIETLKERFKKEVRSKKFILVPGDMLEQDLKKLGLKSGKYKVVANIPYYISGALFRFFLEHKMQPNTMALLVQKEVGERVARAKKESLLSLSVKVYGVPEFVRKVPRGAFTPTPKVDSAIVSIRNISRDVFKNAEHEALFFKLIHAGFAHKRKKLLKALEPLIGEVALEVGGKRAEDIPLETWLTLAR